MVFVKAIYLKLPNGRMPVTYGCRLCTAFSKTIQITKTFHVAMLQRYKGFLVSEIAVIEIRIKQYKTISLFYELKKEMCKICSIHPISLDFCVKSSHNLSLHNSTV